MPELPDLIVPRPATPQRPLEGQTILVVEDSRFACEALRLLSLKSGARLRRADSLGAAARHLKSYRPSIVLVDLGLPDGPGERLIRALAEARPRVGLIVGLSGDDGAEALALAAGADAFLAKPIASLAAFQATLRAAIPPAARSGTPRAAAPAPDLLAAHDDLARAATGLAAAPADEEIAYLARFVAGVARCIDDEALEEAAEELARRHATCQPIEGPRARLSALLALRLDVLAASAA